ncbi:hypothetical protein QZP90_19940 [Serratia marcescens]|uniref:Uncharacterized protein n=1 Tax=Serratia marcescens TaxID=615 RepID=A0ABD5BBK0_SERMA|nr:hypothetical protein [Serratia marcescens]MDP8601504.1 hypothetical protein [Serratia marcescens]MDP8686204.1 hypothetical protein [Serratia marcescens]MDP8735781.1 hypothetical protein [Serratia marcescens]MDP8795102.1 hypothetical protein [Serratia marcescens]MDQ9401637.1 hypothetical protein [Serratia marcescens]
MGVRLGAVTQLPSCNLNAVIIPGDYILPAGNTYTNLPPDLAGKFVSMRVEYENFNTTLLSQQLAPTADAKSFYKRTGSQTSGSLLHGVFGFGSYYVFNGTIV